MQKKRKDLGWSNKKVPKRPIEEAKEIESEGSKPHLEEARISAYVDDLNRRRLRATYSTISYAPAKEIKTSGFIGSHALIAVGVGRKENHWAWPVKIREITQDEFLELPLENQLRCLYFGKNQRIGYADPEDVHQVVPMPIDDLFVANRVGCNAKMEGNVRLELNPNWDEDSNDLGTAVLLVQVMKVESGHLLRLGIKGDPLLMKLIESSDSDSEYEDVDEDSHPMKKRRSTEEQKLATRSVTKANQELAIEEDLQIQTLRLSAQQTMAAGIDAMTRQYDEMIHAVNLNTFVFACAFLKNDQKDDPQTFLDVMQQLGRRIPSPEFKASVPRVKLIGRDDTPPTKSAFMPSSSDAEYEPSGTA